MCIAEVWLDMYKFGRNRFIIAIELATCHYDLFVCNIIAKCLQYFLVFLENAKLHIAYFLYKFCKNIPLRGVAFRGIDKKVHICLYSSNLIRTCLWKRRKRIDREDYVFVDVQTPPNSPSSLEQPVQARPCKLPSQTKSCPLLPSILSWSRRCWGSTL